VAHITCLFLANAGSSDASPLLSLYRNIFLSGCWWDVQAEIKRQKEKVKRQKEKVKRSLQYLFDERCINVYKEN